AAGAVPLRLIFAGTEELTNEGGNYLSPTTCVFSRSVIGQFARREEEVRWRFLRNVDALVVSNYCNGDNFAGEMVSHYFGVPQFRLYIPYKRTPSAVQQYLAEITRLKDQVAEFCKAEVTDDALWDALGTYNELKFKLMTLSKMPLPGSKKQELFYKALIYGPHFLPELENSLGNMDLFGSPLQGKRVLLAGAAPFFGDPLIEIIEQLGAVVAQNLTWTGVNYAMQFANTELRGQSTALEELARVYEKNICSEHYVPLAYEKAAERIIKYCADDDIPGVIYHVLKFCEFTGTLKDKVRERLVENGLKVLQIERDYSTTAGGQLTTRIEAFLEML
ncbi:MAG TPA: 2-hydroxyacyl-CoA dehydratase family protein, partial [Candidatus Lokiarchaeia archaeon]|nr:2-hydroxyacyl-CoA dehydratase family protein [Candidatus Lokiarchaeia archaeon]